MLILTENAVKKFKELLGETNRTDCGIRVFRAGQGCCGPSLAFDIVAGAETGDQTLEQDGVKVFLEKGTNELLAGATMDFSDQEGFILSGMPRNSCCG